MSWDISFHIQGDHFRPSRVNYPFTKAHDPGVIGKRGRYQGQPLPYGSAVIRVPGHIPNEERIKYIVAIALPLLPELERAGATEWHLDIARYYSGQCNETYTAEELALITQLHCPLLYSAYLMDAEDKAELQES